MRLTVIYGSEASRYVDDYGVEKAMKAIKKGKIGGSIREYDLDTAHDADTLIEALCDFDGWGGFYVIA